MGVPRRGDVVIFQCAYVPTEETHGMIFMFVEGPHHYTDAYFFALGIKGERGINLAFIKHDLTWWNQYKSGPKREDQLQCIQEIEETFEERFLDALGLEWRYFDDDILHVRISDAIWLSFSRWYANRLEEGRS